MDSLWICGGGGGGGGGSDQHGSVMLSLRPFFMIILINN